MPKRKLVFLLITILISIGIYNLLFISPSDDFAYFPKFVNGFETAYSITKNAPFIVFEGYPKNQKINGLDTGPYRYGSQNPTLFVPKVDFNQTHFLEFYENDKKIIRIEKTPEHKYTAIFLNSDGSTIKISTSSGLLRNQQGFWQEKAVNDIKEIKNLYFSFNLDNYLGRLNIYKGFEDYEIPKTFWPIFGIQKEIPWKLTAKTDMGDINLVKKITITRTVTYLIN